MNFSLLTCARKWGSWSHYRLATYELKHDSLREQNYSKHSSGTWQESKVLRSLLSFPICAEAARWHVERIPALVSLFA